VAFDPRASETTPEEIAHAGPEEAGLESAFCRASENRPIAGYHAIMEGLRTPHWRSNRCSPVETPGRLNRNRGRRGGSMSLVSAPPCRSPAYVFAW